MRQACSTRLQSLGPRRKDCVEVVSASIITSKQHIPRYAPLVNCKEQLPTTPLGFKAQSPALPEQCVATVAQRCKGVRHQHDVIQRQNHRLAALASKPQYCRSLTNSSANSTFSVQCVILKRTIAQCHTEHSDSKARSAPPKGNTLQVGTQPGSPRK